VASTATEEEAAIYPSRLRYEAPRSLDDAFALLADGGGDAKILAGGQSLVPMLKLRFASPEMLVDINELPGLDYHERDSDGSIRIGALCRHSTLERSSLLAEHQPTMMGAAPVVADPIVRNRGTLVGSLCHADPQGDWASVMMALDASLVAHSPRGRRSIPMKELVRGPFQNTLAYDEIAVEAVVPPPRGVATGGYLKLERRVGDFATAGVAVAIDTVGGEVVRAGIGLTGVGGSTISADDAAAALVGGPLTAETIDEAAELAAQAAEPHSDHRGSADHKRQLIRVFTRRLLTRELRAGEEAA
jgi:aerobic carbon-monoxide dehydrogenase medium subunit